MNDINFIITEAEPITFIITEAEPIVFNIEEGISSLLLDSIFTPPEGGFRITKLYFKDGKVQGEYITD